MPVYEFGKVPPKSIANYKAGALAIGDQLTNGKRIVSIKSFPLVYGSVFVYEANFDSNGDATYELTYKQLERRFPILVSKETN
jgi:hypothetical protein